MTIIKKYSTWTLDCFSYCFLKPCFTQGLQWGKLSSYAGRTKVWIPLAGWWYLQNPNKVECAKIHGRVEHLDSEILTCKAQHNNFYYQRYYYGGPPYILEFPQLWNSKYKLMLTTNPGHLVPGSNKRCRKFCSLHYFIIFVNLSDTHMIVICYWSH